MTASVELGWRMGAPRLCEDPEAWSAPRVRERFSALRESVPTTQVWRGDGPVSELPYALRDDIDTLVFTPLGGTAPMSWRQSLAANHTDGIVVLHKGRIVYEHYEGPLRPHTPHVCMSVTKSLVGTLAAAEMVAGRIDPEALVTAYVPELEASAWGNATVRQVMDMTTALEYDEDYTRPGAEVWSYLRAAGQLPREPGVIDPAGIRAFLCTVQRNDWHGEAFAYKTVNTEVLAWVLCNVTGQTLQQLVQERLWRPMGAEHDAYFGVDGKRPGRRGRCLQRNAARHGALRRGDARQRLLQRPPDRARGRRGRHPPGRRPRALRACRLCAAEGLELPPHVVGDAQRPRRVLRARHPRPGRLHRPRGQMTIARFASHPKAGNAGLDPTTLPAYHALAQHLLAYP
jgi:CubicO group peptidase (beta-lactamase class C family)